MGQLFNRIKNFAKSELQDSSDNQINYNSIFDSDDNDLKRQIDEATKGTAGQTNKNEKKQTKTDTTINLNNAYGILGLPANADIEVVKSAYKKLIREYHPDKVEGLGAEIKEVAERKTKEINIAYNLIISSKT